LFEHGVSPLGGDVWLQAIVMPEKKVELHQGLKNFVQTWCKKYRQLAVRKSNRSTMLRGNKKGAGPCGAAPFGTTESQT
jgi:hypothetical protein